MNIFFLRFLYQKFFIGQNIETTTSFASNDIEGEEEKD